MKLPAPTCLRKPGGEFTYTTNQSEIGMVPLEQMNPIRFATAIRQFSKERGGMERYLVGLCDRMVEEGFEVHVYTERWTEENPKIHFHPVRTIPFPKSLRLLSFAVRATREIERGRLPSVVRRRDTLLEQMSSSRTEGSIGHGSGAVCRLMTVVSSGS